MVRQSDQVDIDGRGFVESPYQKNHRSIANKQSQVISSHQVTVRDVHTDLDPMQGKGLMRSNDTFSALQHPSSLTILAFYSSWSFPAARTHCMANEISKSVMSKGLIQECRPEFQPFVESILILLLIDIKPHSLKKYSPDCWYSFFFLVWCSVQALPPLVEIQCSLSRRVHHEVESYLKFARKIREIQMCLNFEPFQKATVFRFSG